MLKKLYKYDLKSVSLLLVILHAVLIVYTVIGRIGIFIAERAQAFVSLEASRLWGIADSIYFSHCPCNGCVFSCPYSEKSFFR